MTQTHDQLFTKVEKIARAVKQEFRDKGVIVPRKDKDGSVVFDHFRIKKLKTGFYAVLNSSNTVIVNMINLPQTAALIANGLALGRFLDKDIITLDKNYGYKEFDYEMFKAAAAKAKDLDSWVLYETRGKLAEVQQKALKDKIISQFDKLHKVR